MTTTSTANTASEMARSATSTALRVAFRELELYDTGDVAGADEVFAPELREGTDSPAARFASALAGEEGVEVERRRGPAVLTFDQGLTQRAQLGLAVFEQTQRCPDDVAGRAIATRSDLVVDERTVVLVEAEGRVLTHGRDCTNYWYRSSPPIEYAASPAFCGGAVASLLLSSSRPDFRSREGLLVWAEQSLAVPMPHR